MSFPHPLTLTVNHLAILDKILAEFLRARGEIPAVKRVQNALDIVQPGEPFHFMPSEIEAVLAAFDHVERAGFARLALDSGGREELVQIKWSFSRALAAARREV